VTDDGIAVWDEVEVGWDVLHDQAAEGTHHARVADFLSTHGVGVVITGHLGWGMQRMLDSMGIRVVQSVRGDARAAVLAVYADPSIGLS
jgi:predicted Fe-Mo cluster-binding NifX family protein